MHEPSKGRMMPNDQLAESLLTHFEQLAQDAEEMETPVLDLVVGFIEDGDEFIPGTYVPELHLIVRKVEDD